MASETTESRTARDWRQIRWLAVACIIVAALAIYRQRPVRIGSVADFELVGTDVSIVETRGADGGLESLATGDELVLLVFHSECGWCERNAPLWAEWLSANADRNVLGVSTEGVELAAEYARAHDWTVNVRQLVIPADAAADPTFMHYSEVLSSRTPWVFRLSGDGIVLEERHGSEINLLPPTPR